MWCAQPVLIFAGVIEPCQNFAHADPAEPMVVNYAVTAAAIVCHALDLDPTTTGVAGLMQAMVGKSGLTPYQAGEVVALSVVAECPWHTALLMRIAATYARPELRSA